jgi:hypothetical protein
VINTLSNTVWHFWINRILNEAKEAPKFQFLIDVTCELPQINFKKIYFHI